MDLVPERRAKSATVLMSTYQYAASTKLLTKTHVNSNAKEFPNLQIRPVTCTKETRTIVKKNVLIKPTNLSVAKTAKLIITNVMPDVEEPVSSPMDLVVLRKIQLIVCVRMNPCLCVESTEEIILTNAPLNALVLVSPGKDLATCISPNPEHFTKRVRSQLEVLMWTET
jgi:hypothetical protein